MGVPSEKAESAARTILREAEYLNNLDPDDIYMDAWDNLIEASQLIINVLMRRQLDAWHGECDYD